MSIAIDLSQPGRTTVLMATDQYILYNHRRTAGVELVRRTDGASAYFQAGDDADLWLRNLEAIESIETWNAGNSLEKSFNFLCSGYDDILQAA